MAITTSQTLGAGRIGIRQYVKIQSEKYSGWKQLFMQLKTTQDFDIMRQMSDFGYPQATAEGAPAPLDRKILLNEKRWTPIEFTLAFGITKKADYTDQYAIARIAELKSDIGDSFVDYKNKNAMNVYNNGFNALYTGPDGVSLFNTAHPYGGTSNTWSNRPQVDLALSYANLLTARTSMRKVKTARGKNLRQRDGVLLVVPPELEFVAKTIVQSDKVPGSNNNEPNQNRGIEVYVDEDLTSPTAWYLQNRDPRKAGLFVLDQMPFDVLMDSDWQTLNRTKYVSCYESYTFGWTMAQGTWGTTGA